MTIEIVDFPIKTWPFSIAMLVYQRISIFVMGMIGYWGGLIRRLGRLGTFKTYVWT